MNTKNLLLIIFVGFSHCAYPMETATQNTEHLSKLQRRWFTAVNKMKALLGKEAFIYKKSPELLEHEEGDVATSYYYGYLSRALQRYKLFSSAPVFYYGALKVALPGQHTGFLFSGEKLISLTKKRMVLSLKRNTLPVKTQLS